jgi:flagellin
MPVLKKGLKKKMALTINTNLSSLIAQRSLLDSTNALNLSIERMTTGYKINHSKDSAAGYAISKLWETQLNSLDIASDNAAMGLDMLTTAEGTYDLLVSHIQRVRDLTEQAANGTYGSDSLKAISKEMEARFAEIDRIAKNAEFNGMSLMKDGNAAVKLQVGIKGDGNSQITLAAELFAGADLAAIKTMGGFSGSTANALAAECSGYTAGSAVDHTKPIAALANLDKVIAAISSRATDLGAAQNRVDSAMAAIEVQSRNLTSSLSTLRDTDIAEESSNYIQAQILQQASATLLSTANQLPSIALNLI